MTITMPNRRRSWISTVIGVAGGAIVAFPLGFVAANQTASEPSVETREVLPESCVNVLTTQNGILEVQNKVLAASADYPLIIGELPDAVLRRDNDALQGLVGRMETANKEIEDLTAEREAFDFGDDLEECAKYQP